MAAKVMKVLRYVPITGESVEPLSRMTTLEQLTVHDTDLKEEDVERLRELLPETNVIYSSNLTYSPELREYFERSDPTDDGN